VRALSRTLVCQVEDLSAGGAFVRTDQVLPAGTGLELDLVKPGARKALHLTGTVAWAVDPERAGSQRRAPGMGVEFTPPAAEQAERLRALLTAAEPPSDGTVLETPPDEGCSARRNVPFDVPLPDVTAPGELPLEPNQFARAAKEEPTRFPGGPDHANAPAALPQPADVKTERLMVQVRGLIFELAELRGKLEERETQLREALAQLRSARNRIEQLECERQTELAAKRGHS